MNMMLRSRNTSVNKVANKTQASRARPGVITAYAVITLMGMGFFLGSLQYAMFRGGNQVGPAYMPRYAAVLLVVLGVLLLIQEFRGRSRMAGDSGVEEDAEALNRKTVIKLMAVFGLIVVALLLVPLLGLIGAFVLLIPALTIGVERMPIVTSLIVSVVAGVVAYVVFIVVLRVPLPMGIFEGIIG